MAPHKVGKTQETRENQKRDQLVFENFFRNGKNNEGIYTIGENWIVFNEIIRRIEIVNERKSPCTELDHSGRMTQEKRKINRPVLVGVPDIVEPKIGIKSRISGKLIDIRELNG